MANILVIDDDKAVCRFLSDLISSMGYDPTCVLTLAGAREIIRSGRFDVVFLDVNLPDGKGFGCTWESFRSVARAGANPRIGSSTS